MLRGSGRGSKCFACFPQPPRCPAGAAPPAGYRLAAARRWRSVPIVLGRGRHRQAADLRAKVFETAPAEIGLRPDGGRHVWGVVVDVARSSGVASLVSLVDGTTSLYDTVHGGVVGGGSHEAVASASVALVFGAETQLALLAPTDDRAVPEAPNVRIWVLTYAGVLMGEAPAGALEDRHHPLFRLYYGAEEVLKALRALQPRRQS